MIIRDARPDEHAVVGELRVAAYRALGLLPEGSRYAETLRGLGFGGDCVVLDAADETGNGILGTIMLEPFEPASELAMDDTEADLRAFAVAPEAQGLGVGRKLLLAVIERANKRGTRRLRLCTQPAMKAAQHLYVTTGFSRTPELDFEPVPGLTLQAYELAVATERRLALMLQSPLAKGRVRPPCPVLVLAGRRRGSRHGRCHSVAERCRGDCPHGRRHHRPA